MYGDKEIKNAVIINGELYEVMCGENLYCCDCDLPFHAQCWGLCHYFDKENSNAVFVHIETSQILNLNKDETKG